MKFSCLRDPYFLFLMTMVAILVALLFMTPPAHSKDFLPDYVYDPDPVVNAYIHKWIANVKQPDSDSDVFEYSSCCGEGDAYFTDPLYTDENGQMIAVINDDRNVPGRQQYNGMKVIVPPNKLDTKHQGNPTGHNVIFMSGSTRGQQPTVYCMFQDSGT